MSNLSLPGRAPSSHTAFLPSIRQQIEQLVNDDTAFYKEIWCKSIARPQLWSFSLRHIESIKSMQENLNALGIIATFFAAVQAQVITYSIDSNSERLEVAINALFFAGLLLGIFCGCIAYMEAVQLQRIYTLLLRRSTSISAITNALEQHIVPSTDASSAPDLSLLCLHIQFMEVTFLHALSDTRAWETTVSRMKSSQDSIDNIISQLAKQLYARVKLHIQEYRGTTQELDLSRSGVRMAFCASAMLPIIAFAGVTCLTVGVLCYVKHTKPVGVWVTAFTVAGAVLIPFIVMAIQRLRQIRGGSL